LTSSAMLSFGHRPWAPAHQTSEWFATRSDTDERCALMSRKQPVPTFQDDSQSLNAETSGEKQSKQPKPPPVQLDPDGLMGTASVCGFFQRSKMSLARWRKHSDPERRFPEADLYIGIIPYWRRGTILGFVEAQERRGANTKAKELSNLAVAGRQKARAAKRSCNPQSHDNGAKPATNAPAALSPADGDAFGQRSQPFGG
jgi:hypothetical protein